MEIESSSKSPAKVKNVLGAEFAPIHLPWERRAQAVIFWLLLFTMQFWSWPVLLMMWFTPIGFFVPFYIIWIFVDKQRCNRGGRMGSNFRCENVEIGLPQDCRKAYSRHYKMIPWIRRLAVWRYYRDYFPVKLVKTADLDPKRNYLIGNHPHGILCTGAFTAFDTDALDVCKLFPGLKFHLLTFEFNFMFPILRDILLGFGMCAASRKGMNYLLGRPGGGTVGVLIPGGAPESLDAHPGAYVIQLKKRKGFIKVALQNGSALVPSISFGETDIFDQPPNPQGSFTRTLQDKLLYTLQMTPALFLGRGILFGCYPLRKPITVVVGAPIEVEKVEQPTQEQIDSLHQKYVDALVELFYAHREKYALDPSCVIQIV